MSCCGQQDGRQNRRSRCNAKSYNDGAGDDNDDNEDEYNEQTPSLAADHSDHRRLIKQQRASTPEQHPCELIINTETDYL